MAAETGGIRDEPSALLELVEVFGLLLGDAAREAVRGQ